MGKAGKGLFGESNDSGDPKESGEPKLRLEGLVGVGELVGGGASARKLLSVSQSLFNHWPTFSPECAMLGSG